ncbi:hypothetical protein [Aliarcobacter cryaerophilus]|uniref:hypothetical protein n=1 Tax=Aliarcobacter cryaerophilus TaxID=28198 RepID=UPI000826E0DB|nr:hypothetical protein [Aliarcobacter cryaerophilus]
MKEKFNFQNAGKWLDDNWNSALVLNIIGIGCLAIAGAFGNNWDETRELWFNKNYLSAIFSAKSSYFILGIVFYGIGTFLSNKENKELFQENKQLKESNKSIENLRDKIDSLENEKFDLNSEISMKHEELVITWLKLITKEQRLTINERLTIYYEHNKEFTLLARFSNHTQYTKIHKQKFPLHKGVISKSFNEIKCIENNSPIFEKDNEKYYNHMIEKYKFSRTEIESITMKSNKLFGLAIKNADDSIGVLLYEGVGDIENFEDKCDKIEEHYKGYSDYFKKFIEDAKKLDKSNNKTNIRKDENELMKELGGLNE